MWKIRESGDKIPSRVTPREIPRDLLRKNLLGSRQMEDGQARILPKDENKRDGAPCQMRYLRPLTPR